MDDTSQLILTELREFRAAVTEWQQETGERVATLEAHDKDLYGNGREGRVTTVERSVDSLSRFKYWLLGAAAAVSAIAHYFLPGGKH
jgi:hypothetical protein